MRPGRAVTERTPEALLASAIQEAWARSPQLGFALSSLGDRCEVAWAPGIGTARIGRRGDGVRIEFDPEFAAEHLTDPVDALFVVAHEVSHRLQGDLLRNLSGDTPRERFAANVVADVKINRRLKQHVFPAPVPLLLRLYDPRQFPAVLLCPPFELEHQCGLPPRSNGRRGNVLRRVHRTARGGGLNPSEAKQAMQWYADAWFEDASTQPELLRQLLAFLPDAGASTFLGDHDGEGVEEVEGIDEALEAGLGVALEELRVSPRRDPRREALRRKLVRALAPSRGTAFVEGQERTVVPAGGRRPLFLWACGAWPTFFVRPGVEAQPPRRARVYLDVSGSVHAELPALYGLLWGLRPYLCDPLHVFSTEVLPLRLDELRDGRLPTRGGTEFGCVLDHAARQKVSRALVITDGIGPLPEASVARARGVEVHVVHVGHVAPPHASPLRGIARSWERLPPSWGNAHFLGTQRRSV